MTLDNSPNAIRVIDSAEDCPVLPIIAGGGKAKAVLWPGNGARYRTVHLLDMMAGDQTISLKHGSDAVYYVASGKGHIVDISTKKYAELVEGAMIHIDAGDLYRFETIEGMKVIGGPCPADFSLYSNIDLPE